MPLLKPKEPLKQAKLNIEISGQLHEKIQAYCNWAEISKIEDFIEQAAEFIFRKDKEWQKFQKQNKKLKNK